MATAKYRVVPTHIFEQGQSILHGEIERPEVRPAQVVTKDEALKAGLSEGRFNKLVEKGALVPLEGLQEEAAEEAKPVVKKAG